MANKFIVFVVFAAVAQASLVSSARNSSALNSWALRTAERGTRASWYAVGDIFCESVRNASYPTAVAEDHFSSYQMAGGNYFMNVAPLSDNQTLQDEIASLFTALPEAVYKGIEDARKCSDLATINAALENYKNEIPFEQLVEDFHKTTEHTGSWTPAVDALEGIYEKFFNEIEKVALSVCGGGKIVDACASKEIREKIDVLVEVLYSWL